MPTYDQARQYGKTYVAAMNTGAEPYTALFAPGAQVTVAGEPTDPDGVRAVTPAGRSGFRGAKLDPPRVVLTVRHRPRRRARARPTAPDHLGRRGAHRVPGGVTSRR
jgi:hypothetical protein